MRTFKNFMLLVMTISLVTFASCSKDDDGGSGGEAPSGLVTATIDGSGFTSMEVASTATIVNVQGGAQQATIQGGDSTGKTIVLSISGYEGAGTYEINSDDVIFSSATYIVVDASDIQNPQTQSWQAPYADSGLAGTIVVTEETTDNLKGEFTLTVKGGDNNTLVEITNGLFNVSKSEF